MLLSKRSAGRRSAPHRSRRPVHVVVAPAADLRRLAGRPPRAGRPGRGVPGPPPPAVLVLPGLRSPVVAGTPRTNSPPTAPAGRPVPTPRRGPAGFPSSMPSLPLPRPGTRHGRRPGRPPEVGRLRAEKSSVGGPARRLAGARPVPRSAAPWLLAADGPPAAGSAPAYLRLSRPTPPARRDHLCRADAARSPPARQPGATFPASVQASTLPASGGVGRAGMPAVAPAGATRASRDGGTG